MPRSHEGVHGLMIHHLKMSAAATRGERSPCPRCVLYFDRLSENDQLTLEQGKVSQNQGWMRFNQMHSCPASTVHALCFSLRTSRRIKELLCKILGDNTDTDDEDRREGLSSASGDSTKDIQRSSTCHSFSAGVFVLVDPPLLPPCPDF